MKVYNLCFCQEKSEFLLPYLVELVIILIQCIISIINFILLKPYDEQSFEADVVGDFLYDHPKHFTEDEKRFMLGALILTAAGAFHQIDILYLMLITQC